MLILQRKEGESLLIGEEIELTVLAVEAGRVRLAIQAPREAPVPPGAALERQGGQRPACLEPPAKRKPPAHRAPVFYWPDDRERAVRAMKLVFDRLEENGSDEEAEALRKQLDRIIPAFWEDDLAAQ